MISAPELSIIEILSRQAVNDYMARQVAMNSDPVNRQSEPRSNGDSTGRVQIGSFTDQKIGRKVAA